MWAAEPKLEERKRHRLPGIDLPARALTGLLYFTKQKVWAEREALTPDTGF